MITATGINSIDSLIYSSWRPAAGQAVSLTYSFLTRVPADASADDANGFQAMSAGQQQGVRQALAAWAAVANVKFTEVSSRGNIQLGTNNQGDASSGYAYLPDGSDSVSLFTNNHDSFNTDFTDGGFGMAVLIHELGHTLGLKHPGNYDSTGGEIDGPFLPAATDTIDYSQMSYNVGAGHRLNGNYGITPMLYDIQAIQYLYGANMSYHTGADTYSFSRDAALQCIWDAGGTDTLDFSACWSATVINLNAGSFSETSPGYNNISIAYNVTIERAIAGSGGSTIYANAAGNVITGGAGTDVIYEGAGSDRITGGGGHDTVVFGKGYANFTLSGSLGALTVAGDGIDTLSGIDTLKFSDRTIELANFDAVQGGTAGADVLSAAAGNELITGGGGIDLLKFSGKLSQYQVGANGAGFIVADQLGSGGTDLLSGIERIQFSDNLGLALDTNGEAGQLYRLYGAMFDREPDLPGMGFWLYRMDHDGLDLLTIARAFVVSDEFIRTYGANTSDAQYVTSLYANVLNRAPDPLGYAHHMNNLAHGAVSREQLLIVFSQSDENIELVSHIIPVGVQYTPYVPG